MRRKRGRPPLYENKLSHLIGVRFTDDVGRKFDAVARSKNMTPSAYLTKLVTPLVHELVTLAEADAPQISVSQWGMY